jgi:glutaconate CoA-transferase, subunit A
MPMSDAIARFVRDGSTVALGTALEPAIPFAAAHEMIRQGRRDLTLVGPISDACFDQLVGAGCVRAIEAAWVGNVSEGLGHCYRRAAETGRPRPLEVRDHSNFSIALALWAGAWNSPFIPTVTLLGSDIVRTNPHLEVVDGHVRVAALRPDVAVLHVQRADRDGRAHAWGPLGVTEEAALASRAVVLCCDQLVAEDVTLSDPNRVLLPESKVAAVVHEPGGSLPAPLQGYWRRDHARYREYAERSRTEAGFGAWLEEWVLAVPDRAAYLRKLGDAAPRITRSRPSATVDYGDE